MSNSAPSTGASPSAFSNSQIAETAFEKRRGLNQVEVRSGFTQVHVTGLKQPIALARLAVLRAVTDAQVSIDFLKMTPTGMSFIIQAVKTAMIETTLGLTGTEFVLATNRSIVTVHAVNMRDEEGLIASIVRRAIRSGIAIDHVTDMHDRMLLVTSEDQAEKFRAVIALEVENV